jgi:hypothetical protein
MSKTHILDHVLGVGVDGDALNVNLRLLRDEVHTTLTLGLLQLQGDSTNGGVLGDSWEIFGEGFRILF